MPGCRIGFVGAGGVAARHADTLASFDDVELVAVTDVDDGRARTFAEQRGMRAVGDLDQLIDTGVHAVYVCVPPFSHGPAEKAVAAAGLAVFVEKPIGLDCDETERTARLLDESGVVTSVGYHWRYSDGVTRAREAVRDTPVRLAVGAWLDKLPPVRWWARRAQSGGQVIEQAVHVLDLARLMVGEVTQVHAMGDGQPPAAPEADVDGATVVNLRFASGAVGTLAATCLLGWKHRAGLEVYAADLAVSITEDAVRVAGRSGDSDVRRLDPAQAKQAADRAFVDAVLGRGDDIRTPYADAVRTQRLACAVADSAVRGTAVKLEEHAHASG
ncbi:Gfo/Idh/MocA family protein [Amycolatopsis sp. YIM 10]|uniref:Gfo/Idh/MocA family protein n=1 Tax=Amycolatopsis sp. YIM 10 TaxID=2653857 RepID=UPI0012904067|nr:Gfo/Idh/MocA family oxidoreductase [Amycolatopsis sp. YIM 10]QFU87158.1 4-carboxy-2-hydroxymuconate-6-semialdehyde dehydrogenase [Amycolatopsis sp. YIM 10]